MEGKKKVKTSKRKGKGKDRSNLSKERQTDVIYLI
jgi:hypothetical protein